MIKQRDREKEKKIKMCVGKQGPRPSQACFCDDAGKCTQRFLCTFNLLRQENREHCLPPNLYQVKQKLLPAPVLWFLNMLMGH